MLLPTMEPEAVNVTVEIEELAVMILPVINPEVCRELPVMDPDDDIVLHIRVSNVVVPLIQLLPVLTLREPKRPGPSVRTGPSPAFNSVQVMSPAVR